MKDLKSNITRKLIQIAFEQKLFEISQLVKGVAPTCFVGYCWSNNPRASIIFQLEKHLKTSGVKTLIDHRDGQDSITSHTQRIQADSTDFVIYGMSTFLMEKLNGAKTTAGVKIEIPKVIERANKQPNTIIPVLLDGDKFSSIPPALRDIVYIDFRIEDDYYLSFFQLLKRILVAIDMDTIIHEFLEQYNAIKHSSLELQSKKLEAIQELEKEDEKLTHDIINETADILLTQTLRNIEAKKNRHILTKVSGQAFRNIKAYIKSVWLVVAVLLTLVCGVIVIYKPNVFQIEQLFGRAKNIHDWNLPFPNLYFTGREEELKSIASRFDWFDHKGDSLAVIACVGLGGTGKTEIAKSYIGNKNKYSKRQYTFKAWFNAEKLDILLAEYTALGTKLGIVTDQDSPQEIITSLKDWFEAHTDWLIVYDNAENFDALVNFFPTHGGHILVTSRHTFWPNSIEIKSMNEQDAISLLRNILNTNVNTSQAIHLVNTLGRLPLAISHAASYMLNQKKTINSYLDLYHQRQKEILADKSALPGLHNPSVLVTWDINLKEIQKESDLAYSLINYFVYLYPDDIPCPELAHFFPDESPVMSSKSIDEAIQLLLSYSMISKNKSTNSVNIHRLVQAVMWHKQQADHSQKKWISRILRVLVADRDDKLVLGGLATNKDSLNYVIQCYEETPSQEKTSLLYQSLGCCYLVNNDFAKAEASFQAGIMKEPNSSIYCEYGLALFQRKRYEEAIEQLNNSIKMAGDNLSSYFSEMERSTVTDVMKNEIDKIGTIRIRSSYLAQYLLVKCYLELNELQHYGTALANFKKLVESQKDPFLVILLHDLMKEHKPVI